MYKGQGLVMGGRRGVGLRSASDGAAPAGNGRAASRPRGKRERAVTPLREVDRARIANATAALGGSVLIYLLLTLYDLGLGYCNHQLRKHWPALTTDALAAAETASERLFARMQLPLIFAFGGLAFVATAALLLVPYLLITDQATAAWANLEGDGGMLERSSSTGVMVSSAVASIRIPVIVVMVCSLLMWGG